jgi:hypothetical protein
VPLSIVRRAAPFLFEAYGTDFDALKDGLSRGIWSPEVFWRPIDGQAHRRADLAKPYKLHGFARFARR